MSYRVKKDDEGNPRQAEVLMVSTPNRRDMVFPKVTATAASDDPHSFSMHHGQIEFGSLKNLFLGRVGGRRGRLPGGVPRGDGGGRRQGRHQRKGLFHLCSWL
jgi:hypothetical protein